MTRVMGRMPVALLAPAILLAAAYISLVNLAHLPWALVEMLPYVPYGLAPVGAIIGWRFKCSRLVYSLAAMALGHWLLSTIAAGGLNPIPAQVLYNAYAILLPINIAVLSILPERDPITPRGGLRAGVLILQVAVIGLFAGNGGWLDSVILWMASLPALGGAFEGWTRLSELSVLLFGGAGVVVLARLLLLDLPPLESGTLGALIASAAALHTHTAGAGIPGGASQTIYFTVAGLILMVALVQDTYRMAFVDELTDLPGRRALTAELMNLGPSYTIAMADVDHFKKFNDRYGHDNGDAVLRLVASRLARVGGGGKVFRYGGEEFTILFPGKEKDVVTPYLERLRAAVAEAGFTVRGRERRNVKRGQDRRKLNWARSVKAKRSRRTEKKVPLTISIGVADRNAKCATPEAVIKEADKALYRAKKAGRNRVVS